MKIQKIFISVFLSLLFALSFSSCDLFGEDDDNGCKDPLNVTALTFNVEKNGTIEAYDWRFYSFSVESAGEYTISLTNLGSDLDWCLYEYISDCADDYGDAPEEIVCGEEYGDDSDEILVVDLDADKYLLVVEEWDDVDSSFTIEVQD